MNKIEIAYLRNPDGLIRASGVLRWGGLFAEHVPDPDSLGYDRFHALSAVSAAEKYTYNSDLCVIPVHVGESLKGKMVKVVDHVAPGAISDGKFWTEYCLQLEDFGSRVERNSIQSMIFGGRDSEEGDSISGYSEMVGLISEVNKEMLGVRTFALQPKPLIGTGKTDVFVGSKILVVDRGVNLGNQVNKPTGSLLREIK